MKKMQVADIVAVLTLAALIGATARQGYQTLWGWNLPATALLSWLFLRVWVPRMPPALRIPGPEREAQVMGLAVVLLFSAMQLVMVLQPGRPADRTAELMVLVSLFYVAVGMVLPKVRQNQWLGVRVPWTRLSAETWAATHRVAGAAMVCTGLVALVLCAASQARMASWPLALGGVVPIAYSWWHYTQHHTAG